MISHLMSRHGTVGDLAADLRRHPPPTPSWGGPTLGQTPERTMSPVRQLNPALGRTAAIREH